MFKKSIRFLACLLVAVFAMTLWASARPAKAAMNYFEKTTTINADITGDGKADSIKFELGGFQEGIATKLTVYVNGKKALTASDEYLFSVAYNVITLGRKPFLYLHPSAENDYGPMVLYTYKSGKLKKVLDFDKSNSMCMYVSSLTAKGNKLTVSMGSSGIPGLGVSSFKAVYTYSGGKFKKASKIHKITAYAGDKNPEVKVQFSFDIYSDKTCKKLVGTVPAGAKVKVKKLYVSGKNASVYVEGKNYKGWYRCLEYSEEPHLNDEDFVGTYFEGTWMAG